MKNKNVIYFLFTLIFSFAQECNAQTLKSLKSPKFRTRTITESELNQKKIINIFVHGFKFVSNYHFDSFGLQHLSFIRPDSNFLKFAKKLNKTDPEAFNLDDFYIFSWSGSLSSRKRFIASELFYKHLNDLIEFYKNLYGSEPFIRIMGHSHGGTVSLNLAYLAKKNKNTDLHIDELILLATPAQGSTACYVDSPIFKQVYAFYSTDLVPVLAPQGRADRKLKCFDPQMCPNCYTPIFSGRKFPVSKNLIQSKVKFNGRGISHTGFLKCKFPHALPGLLHDLKQECCIKNLPRRRSVYRINILTKKSKNKFIQ